MSIDHEHRLCLTRLSSSVCYLSCSDADARVGHETTMENDTMKRLTQVVLVGVLMLAIASVAAAQGTLQIPSGTPQPAVRLGNFIEVGNDVFMHIIATTDFRYNTTENFDFESKVRDRTSSRNPESNAEQTGESDMFWMLVRFGVDFRYQKSTEVQIVLEQRT